MRSLNGLKELDPDFLHQTLSRYREDIDAGIFPAGGKRETGSKARAYAVQTCTAIVLILARINYQPPNARPPQRLSYIRAAWTTR